MSAPRQTLHRWLCIATALLTFLVTQTGGQMCWAQLETGWKAHDRDRPLPPSVSPSDQDISPLAPGDADILFDGAHHDLWRDSQGGSSKWQVKDGTLIATPKSGSIYTKKKYGDCQLHIEWKIPASTKRSDQAKGNSGVFLMNTYEVQILASFDNRTYADGMAGAIYGQYPPLVNASKPVGTWQSYDIIFRRPRFDEKGALLSPAKMTVLHNGILVQENSHVLGPTTWIKHSPYTNGPEKESLSLQDHGNPIQFRNIWIRELSESRPLPSNPYPKAKLELTDAQMTPLVGDYGDFRITKSGKHLYCKFFQVQMELVPLSNSEFLMKSCAGKLKFDFDPQGRVKQAKLHLDAAGNRIGIPKAATAK